MEGPDPGAWFRAVVFDFDKTLVVRNATVADLDTAAETSDLFGGPDRLAALASLLTRLHAHRVLIAIISFNTSNVITPLLERVGLLCFFAPDFIFGAEIWHKEGALRVALRERYNVKFVSSWSKGMALRELVAPAVQPAGRVVALAATAPSLIRASASSASAVLFVDDDEGHVTDVREAVGPIVATLHVRPAEGLQDAHMQAIAAWDDAFVPALSTATDAKAPSSGSGAAEDDTKPMPSPPSSPPPSPPSPPSRPPSACPPSGTQTAAPSPPADDEVEYVVFVAAGLEHLAARCIGAQLNTRVTRVLHPPPEAQWADPPPEPPGLLFPGDAGAAKLRFTLPRPDSPAAWAAQHMALAELQCTQGVLAPLVLHSGLPLDAERALPQARELASAPARWRAALRTWRHCRPTPLPAATEDTDGTGLTFRASALRDGQHDFDSPTLAQYIGEGVHLGRGLRVSLASFDVEVAAVLLQNELLIGINLWHGSLRSFKARLGPEPRPLCACRRSNSGGSGATPSNCMRAHPIACDPIPISPVHMPSAPAPRLVWTAYRRWTRRPACAHRRRGSCCSLPTSSPPTSFWTPCVASARSQSSVPPRRHAPSASAGMSMRTC